MRRVARGATSLAARIAARVATMKVAPTATAATATAGEARPRHRRQHAGGHHRLRERPYPQRAVAVQQRGRGQGGHGGSDPEDQSRPSRRRRGRVPDRVPRRAETWRAGCSQGQGRRSRARAVAASRSGCVRPTRAAVGSSRRRRRTFARWPPGHRGQDCGEGTERDPGRVRGPGQLPRHQDQQPGQRDARPHAGVATGGDCKQGDAHEHCSAGEPGAEAKQHPAREVRHQGHRGGEHRHGREADAHQHHRARSPQRARQRPGQVTPRSSRPPTRRPQGATGPTAAASAAAPG